MKSRPCRGCQITKNHSRCQHLIYSSSGRKIIGCRQGHWFLNERSIGAIKSFAQDSLEVKRLRLLVSLIGLKESSCGLKTTASRLEYLLSHRPILLSELFLRNFDQLSNGLVKNKRGAAVSIRFRHKAEYWAQRLPGFLSPVQLEKMASGFASWYTVSMVLRAEGCRPRLEEIFNEIMSGSSKRRRKRTPEAWVPGPKLPQRDKLGNGSVAIAEAAPTPFQKT